MDMRLCGPQSRSGRFEEKEILLSLSGIEPRTIQAVGLFVIN